MLARDKRPRIHFRHGFSGDGPLVGWSYRIGIGNFASKCFSLRQLRVGECCSGGGVGNFSVVRYQFVRWRFPFGGGLFEQ